MKIVSTSEDEIVIEDQIHSTSISTIFDYFTKPHLLTQWMANEVTKTPKGFDLKINLKLHQIIIPVSIIKIENPHLFEFVWETEYVMDTSFVEITFIQKSEMVHIKINENANFNGSRWKNPQSYHIKIWGDALNKLKNLIV